MATKAARKSAPATGGVKKTQAEKDKDLRDRILFLARHKNAPLLSGAQRKVIFHKIKSIIGSTDDLVNEKNYQKLGRIIEKAMRPYYDKQKALFQAIVEHALDSKKFKQFLPIKPEILKFAYDGTVHQTWNQPELVETPQSLSNAYLEHLQAALGVRVANHAFRNRKNRYNVNQYVRVADAYNFSSALGSDREILTGRPGYGIIKEVLPQTDEKGRTYYKYKVHSIGEDPGVTEVYDEYELKDCPKDDYYLKWYYEGGRVPDDPLEYERNRRK